MIYGPLKLDGGGSLEVQVTDGRVRLIYNREGHELCYITRREGIVFCELIAEAFTYLDPGTVLRTVQDLPGINPSRSSSTKPH